MKKQDYSAAWRVPGDHGQIVISCPFFKVSKQSGANSCLVLPFRDSTGSGHPSQRHGSGGGREDRRKRGYVRRTARKCPHPDGHALLGDHGEEPTKKVDFSS